MCLLHKLRFFKGYISMWSSLLVNWFKLLCWLIVSHSTCYYGKCSSLRVSVVVLSLKMDSCSHMTASMFVNWMLLQFCSSFFYKEGWRTIDLVETRREMEPGPRNDSPWKDKKRLLDKAGVVQGHSWKTVGTSKGARRPVEQGEWELPGGEAGLADQRVRVLT